MKAKILVLLLALACFCLILVSCGDEEVSNPSQGLKFRLDDSEKYYILTGIGDCEDTEIVIPNKYEGKSVKKIGPHAFADNEEIESVIIPEGITEIGTSAFSGCYELTKVEISQSVEKINNEAFFGCCSLTDIRIPKGVKNMGEDAFKGCFALTVYCEASKEPDKWEKWNGEETKHVPVVWKCNKNDVASNGCIYTVIDGVRYAIKGEIVSVVRQPKSLEKAVIHSSIEYDGDTYDVTKIAGNAFLNCKSLKSVKIPSSITEIGAGAFDGGSSLTIFCEAKSKPESWSSSWCPSGCTVYWGSLIGGVLENGIKWRVQNNEAIIVGNTDDEKNIIIPSEIEGYVVTTIVEKAFFDDDLESVIIQNGVTTIGKSAFSCSDNLKSVVIPNSVTSLGDSAFAFCHSLTSVVLSEELKSIGFGMFTSCENLKEVKIGKKIEAIGREAFSRCESLKSIVIPDSVTTVGNYAFNGCSGLESVKIPNSVTTIADYLFNGCSGLKHIEIPKAVTSIGDYAFHGCSGLNYIEIPTNVASIGDYAFYGCSGIGYVVAPSNLQLIGDYAFYNCTSLISIEIPKAVTYIGEYAFFNCSSLRSIIIPIGVTEMGVGAFDHCNNLKIYVEAETLPYGWEYVDWKHYYDVKWGYNANK